MTNKKLDLTKREVVDDKPTCEEVDLEPLKEVSGGKAVPISSSSSNRKGFDGKTPLTRKK